MREFLTSSSHRVRAGWFWPLVLLALPNCILQTGGLGPPPVLQQGSNPADAVMCDIPKVPDPGSNGCADSSEYYGMSLAHAAVALVQSEQNTLALDWSPAATAACNGAPKKTEFYGPFPDGSAVCINCATQIPLVYPDANAVCVASCIDTLNHTETPTPPGGVEAYCQANAHVSTNFDKTTCYSGACDGNGTLKAGFSDPRRNQEPVVWGDLTGAFTSGPDDNSLIRGAATSGNFDAGGASKQIITHGDGWVEFGTLEADSAKALGLSATTDPPPTDSDPSLADIGFGILLAADGSVHIIEGGSEVAVPPTVDPYVAGDRFRVVVTDNLDGTATISYFRLLGPCTPGTTCSGVTIYSHIGTSPSYPFRVDASLANDGASLDKVTLVRIQ